MFCLHCGHNPCGLYTQLKAGSTAKKSAEPQRPFGNGVCRREDRLGEDNLCNEYCDGRAGRTAIRSTQQAISNCLQLGSWSKKRTRSNPRSFGKRTEKCNRDDNPM